MAVVFFIVDFKRYICKALSTGILSLYLYRKKNRYILYHRSQFHTSLSRSKLDIINKYYKLSKDMICCRNMSILLRCVHDTEPATRDPEVFIGL